MISNEMMSNFYVLGSRALDWIFGETNGTSIVTFNWNMIHGNAKILHLLFYPQNLGTTTFYRYVLCFSYG